MHRILNLPLCYVFIALCIMQSHASEIEINKKSTQEFETYLVRTIQSACHGYMIYSFPDFFSSVESWLKESSPFCKSVRNLPNDESAYRLLKQKSPAVDYTKDPQYQVKYLYGFNENLYRYSDCDDWMCESIRNKLFNKKQPISLSDYKKVEQYCEGNYACIENWFQTWPRPLPKLTPTKSVSLDSLLAQPTAPTPNKKNLGNTISGLTLDGLLSSENTSNHTTPDRELAESSETTLDNVFSGREQLALNKLLNKITKYNDRLSDNCRCSINNSGCYSLKSKSLLNQANQIEEQRYNKCNQWHQLSKQSPTDSLQADELAERLAKLDSQINNFDKKITTLNSEWEKQQQRLAQQRAQQRKENSDAGWLAGVATIVAQAGSLKNGSISIDQAAQNAINVAQNVQDGENWASAMTNTLSSSIPSQKGKNLLQNSNLNNSGNNSISCYNPNQFICIKYTVFNQEKFNQIKQQCQQAPNRIISSCENDPAKRCTISNASGKQVMYSYTSSAEDVKRTCLASGGTYH